MVDEFKDTLICPKLFLQKHSQMGLEDDMSSTNERATQTLDIPTISIRTNINTLDTQTLITLQPLE